MINTYFEAPIGKSSQANSASGKFIFVNVQRHCDAFYKNVLFEF